VGGFEAGLLTIVVKERVGCRRQVPVAIPERRPAVLQKDAPGAVDEHHGNSTMQATVTSMAQVSRRVAERRVVIVNEDERLVH
jgi:hypothetical protein